MLNVIKSSSLEKSIKIILHVIWDCNFRCHYCADEHNFWWQSIKSDYINSVLRILKKYRSFKKYSNFNILVDLTWWEPLLNKDIFSIISKIQNVSNIDLQLTTNWYLIWNFKNDFSNIKDKNNFIVNISIHYFYYVKQPEIIIKNILFLDSIWIEYNVKFLLPDKWVKVEEFLNFRNKIISSLNKNIDIKSVFSYSLIIIHTSGQISDSYDESMLDFYYSKNEFSDISNNDANEVYELKGSREDSLIELSFDGNFSKKYWFWELFKANLNKFKWYKCFYISDNFVSLQIFEDWLVEMWWCCKTLSHMKFNVLELDNLLFSWKKYVECHSVACTMDLCLMLQKEKYNKGKILRLLEVKLSTYLERINRKNYIFKFVKLEIVEENFDIKIFFSFKWDYICCRISRFSNSINDPSYKTSYGGLYYFLYFVNKNYTLSDSTLIFNELFKYHNSIIKIIEIYWNSINQKYDLI